MGRVVQFVVFGETPQATTQCMQPPSDDNVRRLQFSLDLGKGCLAQVVLDEEPIPVRPHVHHPHHGLDPSAGLVQSGAVLDAQYPSFDQGSNRLRAEGGAGIERGAFKKAGQALRRAEMKGRAMVGGGVSAAAHRHATHRIPRGLRA